jgi:phage-related minor tail protein
MAIFKRAMKSAMKPAGMIVLTSGFVISAFMPSISVGIAKFLVNTFKLKAVTDGWYKVSFNIDETVAEMQGVTGV